MNWTGSFLAGESSPNSTCLVVSYPQGQVFERIDSYASPSSNSRFCNIQSGRINEAHFPAFRSSPQAHARLSCPHADSRRQGGNSRSSCERAGTSGRLRRAERYRKAQRLAGTAIDRLLASTRARRTGAISVQVGPNGLAYPRLGLIVPKRVLARAVDRNRAKRILRDWFRRNQVRLGGKDLLVRLGVRPEDLRTLAGDLERVIAADK